MFTVCSINTHISSGTIFLRDFTLTKYKSYIYFKYIYSSLSGSLFIQYKVSFRLFLNFIFSCSSILKRKFVLKDMENRSNLMSSQLDRRVIKLSAVVRINTRRQ